MHAGWTLTVAVVRTSIAIPLGIHDGDCRDDEKRTLPRPQMSQERLRHGQSEMRQKRTFAPRRKCDMLKDRYEPTED